MLYLADELFKQRNKTMVFRVGDPIYVNQTLSNADERKVAQIVREKVYNMAQETE